MGSITVGSITNVDAAILLAESALGTQSRATAGERNTPAEYLEGNDVATYTWPDRVGCS